MKKPPFSCEYQYRLAIDKALNNENANIAIDVLAKTIQAIDARKVEYDAMTDEQYEKWKDLSDYFSNNGAD